MAMAQGAGRDAGKEQFWRGVVSRWQRSELSVRDFCAKESVSEASFYAWRRAIAERDDENDRGQRRTGGTGRPGIAGPVFVPLGVAAAPLALELVLGSNRVVRIPRGFDAATLRQLLALLEEQPSC
jgi:hypothetical protein